MPLGIGFRDAVLHETQLEQVVAQGLAGLQLDGQRVLVLMPDFTRTMPMPIFFRLIARTLLGRVQALDFMAAVGTHEPLDEAALLRRVGLAAAEKVERYSQVRLLNHCWDRPEALVTIDRLSRAEVLELSGGLLELEVPVRLNRQALEYDHLLVCGPVFPHEVVGFSGGNKYFFPGISGPEMIDFTHWLGALITSCETIGLKDTPMRRAIDRAAASIPTPRHALCAVVSHAGVNGVYLGAPEEAWSAAADLSGQVHVRYYEKPFQRVLAVVPEMYPDLWTGAKGMYKTEPVVADGGEVIVYAPHIREFSRVHGAVLAQTGFHVRDYFVKQWERFRQFPWGVLAHSTHLRGQGTYTDGAEQARIQVTLATGIPEAECRRLNLGYLDPAMIHPSAWAGREDEGVLLVSPAGEYLYRVRSGSGEENRL
jgi:nickel-dependent lactate racemase